LLAKNDDTGLIFTLHFGGCLFNKSFGFQPLIARNTLGNIQAEKNIHLVGMAQMFWV